MKLIKEKKIINPEIKVNFFESIFNSAFFTGYIPKASGTFGSIIGILFLFIPGFYNPYIMIISSVLVFVISMFTMKSMIAKYGDDPSVIVIDEVLGQWVTLIIIYFFHHNVDDKLWLISIIAFLFFRLFDITKIPPIKYFDNIKTAFGIMMDDVVAGFYAGIVSSYVIYLIQKSF